MSVMDSAMCPLPKGCEATHSSPDRRKATHKNHLDKESFNAFEEDGATGVERPARLGQG